MKKFFKWLAVVIIFGLFLSAAYIGWMKYHMAVADSKVEEIYSVLFEDSSVRQGDHIINMYASLFDDESANKGHMIFDDFHSGDVQIYFVDHPNLFKELRSCSSSEKVASYIVTRGIQSVSKILYSGTKISVVHCGDKVRASLFDGENNVIKTKVYSYKKEDITHFKGGSVVSRDSSPVKQLLLQFLNEEQPDMKLIQGLPDYSPDAVRNTLDLLAMARQSKRAESLSKPSCDMAEQPKEAFTWPTDQGWINSSYGMRTDPFSGEKSMHHGVDIVNRMGSPVFAAQAGMVTLLDRPEEVEHDVGRIVEIDHDSGYSTRYARLGKVVVKDGDEVKAGQLIGYFLTSNEDTEHLHFEVLHCDQRVNPRPLINF